MSVNNIQTYEIEMNEQAKEEEKGLDKLSNDSLDSYGHNPLISARSKYLFID